VVCAFATDSQLERAGSAAPAGMRAAASDAAAFVDGAAHHTRHLLVDNYRELELKINGLLASQCTPTPYTLHHFVLCLGEISVDYKCAG
jgi:hypothetical protein